MAGFEFGLISHLDGKLTLVCFVIVVFFILFFDMCVGIMEYFLENSTLYNRMIQMIYKELMLMGLVSFTIIIIEASLKAHNLETEAGHKWIQGIDYSHILLFFITFFFVIHAFYLMRKAIISGSTYRKMYRERISELIFSVEGLYERPLQYLLYFFGFLPLSQVRDRVEFRLIYTLFKDNYWLPDDFNFPEYLSRCFGRYALKTINRSNFTWVLLLIFATVNFGRLELDIGFKHCSAKTEEEVTTGEHRMLSEESTGPQRYESYECRTNMVKLFLFFGAALCLYTMIILYFSRLYKIRMLKRIGLNSQSDYLEFLRFAFKEEQFHKITKDLKLENEDEQSNSDRITTSDLKREIEHVLDADEHSGEEAEFKEIAEFLSGSVGWVKEWLNIMNMEVRRIVISFFPSSYKKPNSVSPISDAFNHVPGQNDSQVQNSDKRFGPDGGGIDHSVLSNGGNDGKKEVLAKLAPRSSLIGTWTNDQTKTKFDQPLEYIRAAQKNKSIGQPGRSISAAPSSISRPISIASNTSNSISTSISPKAVSPTTSINLAVNNFATALTSAPPSPTHKAIAHPNPTQEMNNNNITLTESFENTIPRSHSILPPDIDGSPKTSVRAPRTVSVDPALNKNGGNRVKKALQNDNSVANYLATLPDTHPTISSPTSTVIQPTERIRLEIKKPVIGIPGHQHANHNEKSARSAFMRNPPTRRRNSFHIASEEGEPHMDELVDDETALETTVQKFRRMKNEEKQIEPLKVAGWLPTLASDSKSMKKENKSLKQSLARSFSRDGHSLPREVHDLEAAHAPVSSHPPLIARKSSKSNGSNHGDEDANADDASLVEDFNSIYLFHNPSYFANAIEVCILCNCLYMALWMTDFLTISLHTHQSLLWRWLSQLGMIVPIVFVLPSIGYICETFSLLCSISELNLDVVYEVLIETEDTDMLVRDLRERIMDRVTALETTVQDKVKIIHALFNEIDYDRNGWIDKLEFRFLLRTLKLTYSDDRFNRLFRSVDISGDGKIGWDELNKLLFVHSLDRNSSHIFQNNSFNNDNNNFDPPQDHTIVEESLEEIIAEQDESARPPHKKEEDKNNQDNEDKDNSSLNGGGIGGGSVHSCNTLHSALIKEDILLRPDPVQKK